MSTNVVINCESNALLDFLTFSMNQDIIQKNKGVQLDTPLLLLLLITSTIDKQGLYKEVQN